MAIARGDRGLGVGIISPIYQEVAAQRDHGSEYRMCQWLVTFLSVTVPFMVEKAPAIAAQ